MVIPDPAPDSHVHSVFLMTMRLVRPDTTVVLLPNLSSALEDGAWLMTGSQERFIEQMNRSQVLFISSYPKSFSNPQILLSLIPAAACEKRAVQVWGRAGAKNQMDPKSTQV